jgi:hypothetical protein
MKRYRDKSLCGIKREFNIRGLDHGRFVKRLVCFLKLSLPLVIASQLTETWLGAWDRMCVNKGVVFAARWFKGAQGIAQRYTAGQSITPLPFTKCDRQGFPSCLHMFKPYLRGTASQRRAALRILGLFRLVKVESEVSYKTITDPGVLPSPPSNNERPPGSYFDEYIQKFGPEVDGIDLIRFRNCWVQTLEESFPKSKEKTRLSEMISNCRPHLSSKNGPNGPCLPSSLVDKVAISKDVLLRTSVERLLKLTKNPVEKIYSSASTTGLVGKPEEAYHSRLSTKVEPGAKMRVFAICDYWTQSSLTGIHTWNYRWLSSQQEDGTMSHNRVSLVAKEWTSRPPEGDNVVNTSDLTAATDRLPRALQQEICHQQFGSAIGALWSVIVSDRDFVAPGLTNAIKYSVGQPMGALSSWSYLAIWHHMIHRTIMKYNGLKRSLGDIRYLVIGDDGANLGDSHTAVYQTVVQKVIGVDISKAKSFSGKAPNQESSRIHGQKGTLNNKSFTHSCEIAKRVFVNGIELTPVPAEALKQGFANPGEFASLVFSLCDRDEISLNDTGLLPSLASIGDKPMLAMNLAAFPFSCVPPLRKVTQKFIETSKDERYTRYHRDFGEQLTEDILWYNVPYSQLEILVTQALRKMLRDFTLSAQKTVKAYLGKSSQPSETIKVGSRWTAESCALYGLLHKVGDLSLKRMTKSTLMGLLLKANLSYQDLRQAINHSHDLIDIELCLQGRSFLDEKRRTKKSVARLQRDILDKL